MIIRNSLLASAAAGALLASAAITFAQAPSASPAGATKSQNSALNDQARQAPEQVREKAEGAGSGRQEPGGKGEKSNARPSTAQNQPGSARQKQDTPQQSGHPADTGKGGPNTAQPAESGRTQGGSQGTAQSQGGNANVNANLTTEQRTKIRETIVSQKVEPEKSVNIQVSVGAIVPKTVKVHPLPATIVQIQPAWRGYMFFLVGDEIVIVEPRSLRVVAVLPA